MHNTISRLEAALTEISRSAIHSQRSAGRSTFLMRVCDEAEQTTLLLAGNFSAHHEDGYVVGIADPSPELEVEITAEHGSAMNMPRIVRDRCTAMVQLNVSFHTEDGFPTFQKAWERSTYLRQT